jgi:DNA sulfur modification protein DndB
MTITASNPNPTSIDTSRASAITCLYVDDHSVLATLSLGHLLELVPDPEKLEDKKLRPSMLADPTLAKHIEERERIQRLFTGEKKKNKARYADFILERVVEQKHRGTPPILLGTTTKLVVVAGADGTSKVGLPFGRKLISVDGETQRASWTDVNTELILRIDAGERLEDVLDGIRVPVEIHHGLTLDDLADLFYWRNVLGTQVNKNEALSRDMHDPATNIVRHMLDMPIMRPDGQHVRLGSLVMQQSRQVGKNAPEWITLSALRTFVVTMLFGKAGFQYGAKPVPPIEAADFRAVRDEVATVVHAVLQRFAVQFERKSDYLIGAPSILGGIGALANKVLSTVPDSTPTMTLDQLLTALDEIRWEREGFWDGIGTRKTPSGSTTVAGPKEVGYAVADAIAGTGNPDAAARVRGHAQGQVIPPYQPSIPITA